MARRSGRPSASEIARASDGLFHRSCSTSSSAFTCRTSPAVRPRPDPDLLLVHAKHFRRPDAELADREIEARPGRRQERLLHHAIEVAVDEDDGAGDHGEAAVDLVGLGVDAGIERLALGPQPDALLN